MFNIQDNLQSFLDSRIKKFIEELPISYPCKVKSFQDGFVEVETLLKSDDTGIVVKIPIMQSPYLTLPIQEGDIGIALNCSYLFDTVIEDIEIKENIKTIGKNGLFFIPLLQSQRANETSDITLSSCEGKTKAIFNDNGYSLNIEDKTKITATNSDITIELGGQEVISSDGSVVNINTPISQPQTPIDISGSGGGLGAFVTQMFALMDALASGMSGSGTNPTAYNALKPTAQQQINTIIKP